jgi:hypothetical protein
MNQPQHLDDKTKTAALDVGVPSHPLATSAGAAGGAVTGAAVGSVGGPLGAMAGAVVGAVVGGLAGKGAAQTVNPSTEDAYWREAHAQAPYYSDDYTYEDYAAAYRAGYTSRMQGTDNWNDARTEWERRWDAEHANGQLRWKDAEHAVKSAWERANRFYVTSNQG